MNLISTLILLIKLDLKGLDETIEKIASINCTKPQKDGILYGRNLCPYHKTINYIFKRSVPEEEWRRYMDKSQFKVTMLSTHPSVKT